MHLCLSCNQPCNLSAIFCESCRLALLERRADDQPDDLPEMVKASVGEISSQLATLPQAEPETNGLASQAETERGSVQLPQTNNNYLWSWKTADFPPAQKASSEMSLQADPLFLPAPTLKPRTRQKMPRRIRIALIVFSVVGVLALSIDGILLVFSLGRHHTASTAGVSATQPETGQISTSTLPMNTSTPQTPGTGQTATATSFGLSTMHLMFATQASAQPAPQELTLQAGSNSAFSWQLLPEGSTPEWLNFSAMQGNAPAGASVQIVVSVQPVGIAPGRYVASFAASASDDQGHTLSGSPQTFDVTLTVLIPCTVTVTPPRLTFNTNLLQPNPPAQKLILAHSGGCSLPISWSISANASWVTFDNASGVDNGNGSTITVIAKNPGKIAGTETAILTIQASDAQNVPLPISPTTVVATITVVL